ncbi:MAG TPA: DUF4145 domain-containing protein [Gemmatimonadaceae bacterium]|nr:DUF4145 domain-containing protein [Gemmatimonadaceae bacterium]
MVLELDKQLMIERCPHCSVAKPYMPSEVGITTSDHTGRYVRDWRFYVCATCGGVVTCGADHDTTYIRETYPKARGVSKDIPERASAYLRQALDSLAAPAGAVMLTASAVDAMLKEIGKTKGTLYSRIEAAATEHLITADMATWAHEVRLDANDQRHADEAATLPTLEDAKRCLSFALALADFLFVLPARVTRGRSEKAKST